MSIPLLDRIFGTSVEAIRDAFYSIGCAILTSSVSGDTFKRCEESSKKNGFSNFTTYHYERLSGANSADVGR